MSVFSVGGGVLLAHLVIFGWVLDKCLALLSFFRVFWQAVKLPADQFHLFEACF